jgi:hypothetical protein
MSTSLLWNLSTFELPGVAWHPLLALLPIGISITVKHCFFSPTILPQKGRLRDLGLLFEPDFK